MQENLNKIHNRQRMYKTQGYEISKIVRLTKLNPTNISILLRDYIKMKGNIKDEEKEDCFG